MYISTTLKKLEERLRREAFITSPLGIVTSPVYIIRNGLYKSILSIAPKVEGDILDLGCGSKPYESLFINAKSYVGVDVEVSGHNHKDSKVDIFYDGKRLPFPDSHFDAVVSFEVFEHVFNIDEVITEIRRVLKPDGQVLITIPFTWEEHEQPYDFARYTSYGIKHIFEKNKFDVMEVKKSTTYVLAVCQMFITYVSQLAYVAFESRDSRIPARLFQIFFIFPLNLIALFLNFVLPKRYECFCNSVVFSKKSSEDKPIRSS
jgi:SAM-dependent methyltransferase